MSTLYEGRLLAAGKYRLERVLGEGGMGIVWLGTDTSTGGAVALKFLTASGAVRPEFRERLRREARATAAVNHPNVVQILEVIEDEGGVPVLVMEYLVGETLGRRLQRQAPLALEVTASILLPVVSAVGTAHAAGIVHRDLKPENIFLVRGADGTVEPHVLDFGIAKIRSNSIPDTTTGSIMGTPVYMSPEQASGERGIDSRTDVWAIGVILYQCLTGRLPVTGENFGQFFKNLISGKVEPITSARPDLPAEVSDVIMRALATSRAERLTDLRAIDDVLRAFTSVQALRFSTPRLPISSSNPSLPAPPPLSTAELLRSPLAATDPSLARPSLALDVTLPEAPQVAVTPRHEEVTVPSASSPKRGAAPYAIGIAVLVLGGGVAYRFARTDDATPRSHEARSASATTLSTVAPTNAPIAASEVRAPAATPSTMVDAGGAPRVVAHAEPSARRPAASASAVTSAAPPASATEPARSHGGVATEPPF